MNSNNNRFIFKTTAISIIILTVLVFITTRTLATSTSPNKTFSVNGWIPYWEQSKGFSSVKENQKVFNEISPFWYDVASTGKIKLLNNSENFNMISYALSKHITITPLISNEFDAKLVSTIVNNPNLMQRHIQTIVNKVLSEDYSGIDLDYENILAADQNNFTLFVQELAKALHQKNKVLFVTLAPKTKASEHPGQDYKAIGEAADKVRIMAYDYSWATSSPGPIAPVQWVNNVLSYATSIINPSKIELGIPDYGYDWSDSKGKGINYSQAMTLAKRYGVKISNDPNDGPHFSYSFDNINHTVWFENSTSIDSLINLAKKYNLNGISIWSLGGEDPTIYSLIDSKFR